MTDVEVAIIGAGPHGLSAAVHLRREQVGVHVLGEPMSFWRTMPAGMKLRSNISATNMIDPAGPFSIASYAADTGVQLRYPVPLSEFVEYGSWVQRLAVPDVDHRAVVDLDQHPEGFSLDLADGEQLIARRVVIAGGIAPFARVPARFRHLPARLASHTSQHVDLSVFAGRRVAVVGGGQSAFEFAALMREYGAAVEVLARRPEVVWLRRHSPKTFMGPIGSLAYAPTDVGPLWYSRLVAEPDLFRRLPRGTQERIAYRCIRPACANFVRVRLDGVKLSLGVHLEDAEPRGEEVSMRLSDGTERTVDHLMFATGFEIDIARYPFLSAGLLAELERAGGYPVLHAGLETSVPGLHIVGAPAAHSFGPILRFVSGSWYAGTAVARAIAAASRRRGFALHGGPRQVVAR